MVFKIIIYNLSVQGNYLKKEKTFNQKFSLLLIVSTKHQ